MSKLNEEILDTLYDARQRLESAVKFFKEDKDDPNMRLAIHKLERLDRVWDYFNARRMIEECRPDEERF